MPRKLDKRGAAHFFVQFRQLAGNGGVARAEYFRHVGKRIRKALRRFEEHQRGRDGFQFFQRASPLACLGGKEPAKEKPVGRKAGFHQGGEQRRSAGDGVDGDVFGQCGTHQLETGVGNERGSRVAHQRDAGAGAQPRQEFGAFPRRIGIVVGDERPGKTVDGEELGGGARIFGGNKVAAGKHVQRTQGNIARVADGRGDNV